MLGHSLNTPGKRSPNGVREWSLNNKVCSYIEDNLKLYGVKTYRVDDITGKTDVTLNERVKRCNVINPTVMVSIHHNAFEGKFGNHGGTEVLTHNKGTNEDKKLANILAPIIASKCRLRNRGVKSAVLGVLNCKATAVLCEGGFMDSFTDNPVVCSEAGQKAYADAVTEGLVKYLGLKLIPVFIPTKPAVKTQSKYMITSLLGLRCRSGSGLSYKVVKVYKYKELINVDTIVKGWAKTKDGWVSTAWIKKI